MISVIDAFTDTNGTLLTAHTSGDGHTWSQTIESPGGYDGTIQSNQLEFSGTAGNRARYQFSFVPPTSDYEIEVTHGVAYSERENDSLKVFARCTGTGENCGGYSMRVDVTYTSNELGDTTYFLNREGNGSDVSFLQLGTVSAGGYTWGNKTWLKVEGSTISLVSNSGVGNTTVTVLTATDHSYRDRGFIQVEGTAPARSEHLEIRYDTARGPTGDFAFTTSPTPFTPTWVPNQSQPFGYLTQYQIGVGGLIPIEGQLWPRGNFKV